MKKILSILSIVLLGVVACNKQSFGPDIQPVNNEPVEGAKVTIHFSVGSNDVETRGWMTDQPNITPDSSLYVFVYNATTGALIEVAKATIEESITQNTPWGTSGENSYNTDFTATVTTGSAPRYMQFIVDPPTYETDGSDHSDTGIGYDDGGHIYIGESESNVVSKLYNKGGFTSYWQRVYLENGISIYTYPGGRPEYGVSGTDWTYTADSTPDDLTDDYYIDGNNNKVYYGDYVNGAGRKITDGTGYIASTEVANLLKYIPMVRNFVKIEVSAAEGGNFVPEKAVLINTPAAGYIAPYSSASGFVTYYQFQDKLQYLKPDATATDGIIRGTAGVASTGFTAPVPGDTVKTTCPAATACVEAVNGVISLFMYERGVPTANPTQLLVYGSLNGTNTWLKIDIMDEDGKYVAFYREFTYEMAIGNITGTTGHSTMAEAFAGPSIGNPSSSPETATLTQVTDGKGVGIWVDFIDYASFDTDGETVRLRYKFWDNTGVKTSTATSLTVSHSTTTGAITTTTLTGSAYSGTDTQDGADGWYYVDVPLHKQESSVYRSVLRVSGTGTNSAGKEITLYRDVTFSVMPTQTFTVTSSTLAGDAYGNPVTFTITVPDGLGYSLFPLVIRIEAHNGSLNPLDTDLPVSHGVSTFSTLESTNTYYRTSKFYWFEKTISYEDYSAGTRTYTAKFTTIYQSGNETVVAVSDPDGHFYTQTVALAVGE